MALTRPRYSQIPDTDWKQSVRVATTSDVGNVMLAAMPNTVDGVTLNFYDRILVKAQANAAQNGIYYVKAVGTGSNGIWERTKDASSGGALGAVTPSIVTMVEEGDVNKNRTFKLTTTGNIDLGTTNLSFGVQAAEPAGSTGQLQFANVNNVIGGATTTSYDYVTGNLVLTGNVNTTLLYQAGKRVPQVFTSATPPNNPAVGDQWYQIGTDILYEWLQDGATAYWIDVSGATIANINPITGESVGQLTVNGGQESTSTTTGALQVVGGVGITGNLNVGGSVSFGGGQLGSDLVISSVTPSTSETTGAIKIASPGGLGVGGNIWAGGAIVANSRIPSTSITTGAIVVPGIGGVGIGGNLNVGGTITGGGVRQTISSNAPTNPTVGDQWYQLGTDILYQYVSDGTGNYWVDIAGATVANITAYNQQSLNDIGIVSGTPSTSATTGALTVAGGVGVTGNLNLIGNVNISGGNIVANQNVTSTNTTTGAIVIVGQGGLGVGGNINAGGNLAIGGNISAQSASFLQNVTIAANLTAAGTYFSAGGLSVTNGNVVASGTNATIGGLTITNGAISGIASLSTTGSLAVGTTASIGANLTVSGNLDVTGNITGGGLRKYAQVSAPTTPVVGDVWYKTDTDVYYTYVFDGTNRYWVDYVSAAVGNVNTDYSTVSDLRVVSGNPATNTTSGALQVLGGAGITGNVYAGNISATNISAGLFTYANGVSILEGNQGTYSNANVIGYLGASNVTIGGNLTAAGSYFSAGGLSVTNGNIVATGTTATIGGLVITNGSLPSLPTLGVLGAATIGGDLTVTGNVTGGGLRKYAQISAPANPIVGDVWYKTDTDVYYQYITDGTKNIWVDYTSATVSNASPTQPQSLQDLTIVSGTPSTNTSTGALVVQGGAGVSGNINAGNVSANNVSAGIFTYANGVSIFSGYYQGTYSNANVVGYLEANGITATSAGITTTGNLTASGSYLSAGGITALSGVLTTGNIISSGTKAVVGGLTIENGGISSLASLNVIGSGTIGGDLAITGNITGGGIRKYSQINAPTNPIVGDQWYKTDTDTLYQYINDGTNKYWIDFAGATVSNASITSSQIAYDIVVTTDTQSTSATTGAIRVQGGIGLIGNIYTTGIADFGGNLRADNVTANNNLQTNTLQVLSDANVTGNIAVNRITASGNIISSGQYFSAAGLSVTNGNIVATGTTATIGGLQITNGSLPSLPSIGVTGLATFGANIDVTGNVNITGNVTGGGLRKYAQISAPTNPVVGDVWYKTDTDVFYQYITDGTKNIWVDYTSATVSNANPTSPQSLQDLTIVSGTPSTSTTTGALVVTGGAGVSGNINAGNISATNISASLFTYANGVSILAGNEGTYSNANVVGYLAANGITATTAGISTTGNLVATGNITASGSYLSAGGITASSGVLTVGNIISSGTKAVVGGVTIENGGIGTLASLSVTGAGTIGGDFAVTGNITGGGLRKYAQVSAPTNPVVGDVWYKTDTDVYYTYINDGTNKYWVDYVGATVSNATTTSSQIAYDIVVTTDTQSTSTTTGAVRVQGGIGLIGNIYTTGIADFGGNLRAGNITANNNLQTNTLQVIGDTNVNKLTAIGNITSTGTYFSAAGLSMTDGNLVTTGTSATIAGLQITNGALPTLPTLGVTGLATFGANIDVTGNVNITGNVTGGGLRKYAQVSAPANPIVGDVWYKTDTDVFYQYITDGTKNIWVDYTSATVSNASPTQPQSLQDLTIVSGTPSTSTTTGALIVTGGAGVSGNINAGNISATNISAGLFTYANGVSILAGNEGTYSNANVLSYLAANGITVTSTGITTTGNITASGSYFSAAGLTVNNGNITTTGTTATISGLVITNGSLPSLPTLGVLGAATVGGDLTVTGNVTGGGIRKTTSISAPANPVVGDQWYKQDTDTLYQYINDGASNYWIDVAGATVSNARTTGDQIAYDIVVTTDTQSTSATTGAIRVQGGIGLIGNIYTTGIADFGGNLRAGNITANNNLQTNTLQVLSDTNVNKLTASGNITSAGNYFSAAGISVTNGNLVATGTTATIGGLVINNGGLPSLPTLGVIGAATFGANVDVTGNLNVTGNVTGGGLRKYAQISKPTNAVPGDVWYKTDTDVYYTYVNDGTNSYWIDYVGATVSNAAVDNSVNQDFTIASGTLSTDPNTGALVVVGGVGITGDINTTGDFTIDGTFTACTAVTAGYLNVADGIDSYGNVIIHGPGTANYTVQVRSSDAADNVLGIKTSAPGGGFTIDALNSELIGATPLGINANTFSIGIKNSVGTTVQADALKVDTAGNTSIAKTLSIGQHVNVTGNVTGSNANFTKVVATTANFTTLNLSGTLTVPTLNVTTSIDAPGIRKYAQVSAPANPTAGDVWYKTDTDVYYTYVNDGTSQYWIDYVGATVSNAATTAGTNQDFQIASGTESTNNLTGALTVVGGLGVSGNINANNINATTFVSTNIQSDHFYFANGVSLASGITGTYSNVNVAAYLAGSITTGDITSTGNIVGGGVRKTTSLTAPVNPVVGDLWYKTDTDVLYQYINDGANNVWVDYVGPTVSNAAVTSGTATDYQFTSGTPSTDPTTGAVTIAGGLGITGDIFTSGLANFGSNVTVNNLTANLNVQTTTLAVTANLVAGNISTGIATIARADIAGALTVGGDVTITGNIDAGGVRKYAQINAPANPIVGDVWYKTDTDVYYTYINDGTNKYWIDYVGATVSNASPTSLQSIQDLAVVGGTASTNTSTGAIVVAGGVGVSGNINAGNVSATNISASLFTYANGVSILAGNEGTYSNANVIGYLSAQGITTPAGNLISSGTYFSAGGLTVNAGNLTTTGTTATIAGLTINNGSLPSLPTLGVVGSATIGGDLEVTGNITGGGLRKYAQISAPANPIVGDVWYKTDTDVYYQYINDGTNSYWIDYSSATVSNASPTSPQSLQDLQIVSGTASTGTSTGALVVQGGAGVSGNINAGNIAAGTVSAGLFTYANGASILDGYYQGTYSDANVIAYLSSHDLSVGGNVSASGTYLSAAGLTVLNGNITASGTSATIGGLVITNGSLPSLPTLGVVGTATIGGDLSVTGNITGGGLRKYAQSSAPANPVLGDIWYKTDTDVYYTYVNDGTNNYWIDYTGPTVSNASVQAQQQLTDLQVVSGTQSTSPTTGALTISGGAGITGDIYTAGNVDIGGNVLVNNLTANNNIQASTLAVTNNATIGGTLSVGNVAVGNIAGYGFTTNNGNLVATGAYFSAAGLTALNGNLIATGTRAEIGGLVIENGGFAAIASLGVTGSATIGGDLAVTGNITGGGLRKYAQINAPANPVQGDIWYKTDTDVYYQYISDGTSSFWVDYTSATVANVTQSAQTVTDIYITSGTNSTDTSTGALRIAGGAGITGNVNIGESIAVAGNATLGNLDTGTINASSVHSQSVVTGTSFTYPNGVSILTGNEGTYSNANVADYLTAQGIGTDGGNLTATGSYFSAGGISALAGNVTIGNINGYGFTVANGNVIATGSYAQIGGLEIVNGGFGNLASLGVIGSATVGGDLAVTGNITGGGLRKYAQPNAPATPVVGDVWYKTDTDIYYQYITDGSSTYWVDFTSAAVANITAANAQYGYDVQFVSGTLSTDPQSGAVQVIGGVGITGNINATGQGTFADILTAQGLVSNTSITGASLSISSAASTGDLSVTGNVAVTGNITASGTYFSAAGVTVNNGNIVATGTTATIGGLVINNGALPALPSIGVLGSATIGGDLAVTGNITGGGIRKTTSVSAPANPTVGDIWYKQDTDVYYEYINDGTGTYWVDMVSPTVANVTQSAQTVSDISITSGTPSVNSTTGALTIAGGAGITGDLNVAGNASLGNLSTGTVNATGVNSTGTVNATGVNSTGVITATAFTYANNTSILDGYYQGFYSNSNVAGYIASQGITTAGGNLTASGSYFSAGGLSVTAGNISAYGLTTSNGNVIATGTYAKIGGLEIINGGFGSLASLDVVGAVTIGADLAVTGNITGGGLRKYAQSTAPANPVVGDVWYKTDTDIYYQYITDGTKNIWVDYTSATVADLTLANAQLGYDIQFVSGTLSTSPVTGAVQVIGGVGITGNVNATGSGTFADTLTAQIIISNTSIAGATLSLSSDAVVGGNLSVTGNATIGGNYFTAAGLTVLNGNINATGTTATIAGLTINNGALPTLLSIGVIGEATFGNVIVSGDISGGSIRKTTSITAPANPTIGDQWYKQDTDVLYQYINDGTSTHWVDVSGATIANVTQDFDGLGDFQTVGNIYGNNVIANGFISDNYYYANGVPFVTTTIANTADIIANTTNGFNLGVSLTTTGVGAGTYGSATSIPTISVDDKGRITNVTTNSVSTTVGLSGNVGTGSVNGGSTLFVVGVPNQIQTTVLGNTISIGLTPNITFQDFTVAGNLTVPGYINYAGGGLRTITSATPPDSPVNGDMWYQTGTDILYRYVNDGTSEYWLDLFSTPLRAILPSRDIGGDNGEVQWNDNGTFGANINFAFDKTTGTLKVERFRITNPTVPGTATSTGLKGEIAYDNEFVYICYANNLWARAPLYGW